MPDLHSSLETLLRELVDGPPGDAAWMLNAGDAGLLRSLDKLPSSAASAASLAGATIAAHADHVRYGLSLLNRWAAGESNPWSTADWAASWKISKVTDEQWTAIRQGLATEARRWLAAVGTPRDYASEIELNGVIGSVAHVAYHLGAIRQIDRSTRGPKER